MGKRICPLGGFPPNGPAGMAGQAPLPDFIWQWEQKEKEEVSNAHPKAFYKERLFTCI